MFDFDYMVPEIIPSALRSVHGGESIKVNGTVYVPERTCKWTDDADGVWHGECGIDWLFMDGGVVDNGVVFCPKCGGEVKVVSE